MRTCSKCVQTFDESSFYKRPNGKLFAHCKRCHINARGTGGKWFVPGSTHKGCPRCKQVLPLEGFYHRARSRSGRSTYCQTCSKELQRKYPRRSVPWRLRHLEQYRQYQRIYHRTWAALNPDKLRSYVRRRNGE